MLNKIAIFSVLLLMSQVAFATTTCTGKVTKVAINSNGELRITTDFRTAYFAVCNTDGSWNDIGTLTCMAWFSQLELAYKDNLDIRIHYPTGIDCSSFTSGSSAPKPDYIINH